MKQLLMALPAVVMLAACGGNPTAVRQAPALGRYALTYESPPYGLNSSSGVLTLTYSARDSIAGTWAENGISSATDLGFFNLDAYLLYLNLGTLKVRLEPDGAGLRCQKVIVNWDPIFHGLCTITYTGR